MKILAIESSADESGVCIIAAEGIAGTDVNFKILGNVLASQISTHIPHGGIVPNLAKREHAKNLMPLLELALREADMFRIEQGPTSLNNTLRDELKHVLEREPELFAQLIPFLESHGKPTIDTIAVTVGPGLEPALWVGVNFARALALVWNLPIVAVNHMEGHIVISAVRPPVRGARSGDNAIAPIAFPALALLISGGHTELVLMPAWFSYEKIGQTRDDAVGEAFDKVARLLGLPYPGGPEISKLAKEAREKNIFSPFPLPRGMIQSGDLDFSFSGLKTAVRRELEKLNERHPTSLISDEEKCGIAREFEESVADVFVAKVRTALEQTRARTFIVGGGVAANDYIKQRLSDMIEKEFPQVEMLICPAERATDNALMIALAGYLRAGRGDFAKPEDLVANGNLSLG